MSVAVVVVAVVASLLGLNSRVQVGQTAAACAMIFNTAPASANTIKGKECATNPTAIICSKSIHETIKEMICASYPTALICGTQVNYATEVPTCQPEIRVVTGTGDFSFAVIGDWGRTGAVNSLMLGSPGTDTLIPGSHPAAGFCLTKFKDTDGGMVGQANVAQSMARSASNVGGISAVFNTGDNFYECGVDNPSRFTTDWLNIYMNKKTLNTQWYNTIGNHDLPLQSVQYQLDYAKKESRWVLPCRYYAVDFVNKGLGKGTAHTTVRVLYINTNPFVTSYQTSKKYAGAEIDATSTPQAIQEQLDWIEAALANSTATWNIIVGHHPMVSGTKDVFGPPTFAASFAKEKGVGLDSGMPGFKGASWTQLYNLINKYNVALYFNGHDHILSHQVDPLDPTKHKTQYVTTGAGAYASTTDGCGYASGRSYIKWVGGSGFPKCDAKQRTGTANVGYNLVRVTADNIKVDFYTLESPNATATSQPYSFTITDSNSR